MKESIIYYLKILLLSCFYFWILSLFMHYFGFNSAVMMGMTLNIVYTITKK